MTETKLTGRGGAGRGQGRKPKPPDEVLHTVSVRLSQVQRDKVDALGGLAWLREKIDKAKDSDVMELRPPQVHQTAVDMFVTPIRLTVGQKEKMARLGGSAWLRDRIDLARGPKKGKK